MNDGRHAVFQTISTGMNLTWCKQILYKLSSPALCFVFQIHGKSHHLRAFMLTVLCPAHSLHRLPRLPFPFYSIHFKPFDSCLTLAIYICVLPNKVFLKGNKIY